VDVAGGEQAVMADLDEAFGEDMEDEASKKLVGRESDLVRTACAKGDAVLVEGDEAVIADADTMGVLAEVAKDLLLVAEGRLAVDDPPDTLELVTESPEAVVIGEGGGGPVEVEPPFAVSEAHCIEELSAEELPQGVDRKEVVAGGGDPALGIRGQTTAGDDAVDVGVKAQVSSPGVKDGGDTEVGAEALWITPEFEEGSGGGREEGVEDEVSIREGEAAELSREVEDDVEGMGGEHASHALLDPASLRERLALWTVPVSTGVEGVALEVAAGGAHVLVSAELGGPATSDVAQDRCLLGSEGVGAREGLPVSADDVRDLESGPFRRAHVGSGTRVVAHGGSAESLPCSRGAEQVNGALDAGDVLGSDPGVAESGGDVGVTEEHLDDADVGAELEEVGSEAVAQDVRCDGLLEACAEGGLVQVVANGVDADAVSRLLSREELGSAGPASDPVATEDEQDALGQGDESVLTALCAADVEEHALGVDVGDAEGADLADAESGAVGGHDDGAVLWLIEGGEEGVDLGAAEDVGESGLDLWIGDGEGDVGALEGIGEEEAEGGDTDLEGGVADAVVDEAVNEKLLDLALAQPLGLVLVIAKEEAGVTEVLGAGLFGETSHVEVLFHAEKNVAHGMCPVLRRSAGRAGSPKPMPEAVFRAAFPRRASSPAVTPPGSGGYDRCAKRFVQQIVVCASEAQSDPSTRRKRTLDEAASWRSPRSSTHTRDGGCCRHARCS